jgi:hypothetical protein
VTTKLHLINAGPHPIVVHVQGANGKAQRSSRQLLPGEHAELFVAAGQYLQVVEVTPSLAESRA